MELAAIPRWSWGGFTGDMVCAFCVRDVMEMGEQMVNRWVDCGRDNTTWSRNLVSLSSWLPRETTLPSFFCNLVEPHD